VVTLVITGNTFWGYGASSWAPPGYPHTLRTSGRTKNLAIPPPGLCAEADEPAAAKIWDDAMVEVIGANKWEPNGNLAKSSAGEAKKLKIAANKVS
jgi:hypothetical protein